MTSTTAAVFRDLNAQQTDGMSCVVCNAPFHVPPVIEHVPVGVAAIGGQVFACNTAECAMAIGYVANSKQPPPAADCAPEACVAPETGVHTSCPGPAAGAMMASAQKSDDEEDARWRRAEREIDGGFTGTEFPRLWPPRQASAANMPGSKS